jgi:hypothetical protein
VEDLEVGVNAFASFGSGGSTYLVTIARVAAARLVGDWTNRVSDARPHRDGLRKERST